MTAVTVVMTVRMRRTRTPGQHGHSSWSWAAAASAFPRCRRRPCQKKSASGLPSPPSCRPPIHITADGKLCLFAVGVKRRVELAREGDSLLAVYEFLAAEPPPPGTFRLAIDSLTRCRVP